MPVLAAATSGELRCGEFQGRVNGAKTKMVARFGKLRQAGKRARDQQRLGRVAARVGRMPACLDKRGHRLNSDLRLT